MSYCTQYTPLVCVWPTHLHLIGDAHPAGLPHRLIGLLHAHQGPNQPFQLLQAVPSYA